MLKKSLKTFFLTLMATVSVFIYSKSSFAEPPATCTGVDECSKLIYQTTLVIYKATLEILASVQELPVFIESWLATDDSDTTSKLQQKLIDYMTYSLQNDEAQFSNTNKPFMQEHFSPMNLPYPNQMIFTTLLGLGSSLFTEEKDKNGIVLDAQNYIKNASGLNFQHATPDKSWQGSEEAKQQYDALFKSFNSATSYNAYVLNNFYSDYLNNFNLSNTQRELSNQASDSNWFQQVASEDLGIVLRQILMFNSQAYVLLLKLVETQRQQLAGQAIANTLLILNGYSNERDLYIKAIGAGSSNQTPLPQGL